VNTIKDRKSGASKGFAFITMSAQSEADTRSMMRVFFENNPISERRPGVENDLANVHAMDDFPWEAIRVSSLLIHGDADTLIPVEYGHVVARRIPNAEIAVIKGGGHQCLVSRLREVAPLLNAFLVKYGAK
jgi:pimeloyl-ACP methyl ester carboxylesterase